MITVLLAAGCAGSVAQVTNGGNPIADQGTHFLLPTPRGPVLAMVTAGPPPNLPESSGKEWLTMMLGGLALAPLGIVAPPLYASAIVVGGALVATGSAAAYGSETVTYGRAARAVQKSNLPAVLSEALQTRSIVDHGLDAAGQAVVAVPAWGLIGQSRITHCFVAAVDITVSLPNRPAITEQIRLTLDPTEGVPPVQCASLSRFNEDDGRLIRETVRDYAELLAELITDRLERLE